MIYNNIAFALMPIQAFFVDMYSDDIEQKEYLFQEKKTFKTSKIKSIFLLHKPRMHLLDVFKFMHIFKFFFNHAC